MKNTEKDELYEAMKIILLHKGKARAFLRRLKKEQPNDWQRVYGNVYFAWSELKES